MSWKVLITARTFNEVGGLAHEKLKNAGCEVIVPDRFGPHTAADLLPLLPGVDAVLCSPDQYSEAVLNSPEAATLKIISRWGVGYDSIDHAAAAQAGVVVAFTPGVLNETVADYTFALLLSVARRVHAGHHGMASGEWNLFWGHDVHGKTLGIIGCGRIGQAVARRASGFGQRVLGYDVTPVPETSVNGIERVGLEQLLAESDFVTLHAALSPESRGMIGEKELRSMKPNAYLINAGRGALLDESALVRALKEGWIAGAALDTYSKEPLPVDHPLRSAPNILLTPHLASFARETGERVSLTAAESILELMHGRKPQFVVNPTVFDTPALRAPLNQG
jgi:phosphoglycerate dehydrogenase-like enzyme